MLQKQRPRRHIFYWHLTEIYDVNFAELPKTTVTPAIENKYTIPIHSITDLIVIVRSPADCSFVVRGASLGVNLPHQVIVYFAGIHVCMLKVPEQMIPLRTIITKYKVTDNMAKQSIVTVTRTQVKHKHMCNKIVKSVKTCMY